MNKTYKYLLPLLISGLLCLSHNNSKASKNPEIAFQFLTDDSILLDIYAYFDDNDLLEGYTSHIITPVCEDSSCYDAEIHFYWDPMGNFKTFKINLANPLTKLDHIPFSKSDYKKLLNILFIKSPSFVYLKRSQLVEEVNSGIDGMTSATATQVKEDMVHGAIYTCYTLWHIANGQIIIDVKKHTAKSLNEKLIHKLLTSENVEEHFFVIENIDVGYFNQFLSQILTLAGKYKGYFIMSVIENIPTSLMEKNEVQDFFSANFNQLAYQVQINLLEKLYDVPLKNSLQAALINGILPENSIQNENIIRLIIKNADEENIYELRKLFKVLQLKEIVVSEKCYKELISMGNQYKSLKKEVRRFKKAFGK